MKKGPTKQTKSTQVLVRKKIDWFQRLTFENVHKAPHAQVRKFAMWGTSSLFQSLWN